MMIANRIESGKSFFNFYTSSLSKIREEINALVYFLLLFVWQKDLAIWPRNLAVAVRVLVNIEKEKCSSLRKRAITFVGHA